jgi:hypothetical protein
MSLQMHITGRRIGRGPRWSFLFSDRRSKEMDDIWASDAHFSSALLVLVVQTYEQMYRSDEGSELIKRKLLGYLRCHQLLLLHLSRQLRVKRVSCCR